MAKPWTAEELTIMKQRYPKEGASDALVKTLNRTKQAIHFKAQQVGLRNVKRKRFTDEDIEILRARYPNEGASKDIQKLLCRSAATINRKARLLGIKALGIIGPRKRRIFSLRGILGKVQARVF